MGYSSEMAIAEANRNENNEAISILCKHVDFLRKNDFLSQAVDIMEAVELIKKFEKKHTQQTAWELK